jgi:hypothetical protein
MPQLRGVSLLLGLNREEVPGRRMLGVILPHMNGVIE